MTDETVPSGTGPQFSADQLSQLLGVTAEGIICVDADTRITYCNTAAAHLLRYTSSDDLLGAPLPETVQYAASDGSPLARGSAPLALALAERRRVYLDDQTLWRRDGSNFAAEVWCQPLPWTENNGAAVISFMDITRRQRHQQRLKAMQENAERANRTKSVFLANISHELRTPLAAILGFGELLQQQIEDRAALDKLHVIKRNSLHLLDLLNDLLDLSKIESGYLTIELETIDLVSLFADLRAVGLSKAREKDLDFDFRVSNPVPAKIKSDPVRLRQIVLNLLTNAVKYTDQGSIRVAVAREMQADGAQLVISVTDTGRGISPTERHNLFKAFIRGADDSVRRLPGTGLGLSISQQLAAQLGGEITFDSEPGTGSQFRLRLPLAGADAVTIIKPGPLTAEARPDAMGSMPELKASILVVDDNDDIRNYLGGLFTACGARATCVASGPAALGYLRHARGLAREPDLVLMDMQMPELSGPETLARIRAEGFHLPVIAITASAMKGEREKILLAGFDDYVAKPFNAKGLATTVTRHLRKSGEPPARPRVVASARGNSRRVLVVDDNVDITLAVKEMFALHGFEVAAAYDGAQALSEAQRFKPDAVLLDIGLPDLSGFAVCEQLKALRPSPAVIAVTGHQAAEQHGFDAYLIKPATFADMLQAVESVLPQKADGKT